MKSFSDSGKVEEFQGKKLDKAIEYTFSTELFENIGELKQSEEWPSDSDILKMVNNKRKTAAKASAYQGATEALRNEYNNSDEKKWKDLVAAVIASGKDKAAAEAFAESVMTRPAGL